MLNYLHREIIVLNQPKIALLVCDQTGSARLLQKIIATYTIPDTLGVNSYIQQNRLTFYSTFLCQTNSSKSLVLLSPLQIVLPHSCHLVRIYFLPQNRKFCILYTG